MEHVIFGTRLRHSCCGNVSGKDRDHLLTREWRGILALLDATATRAGVSPTTGDPVRRQPVVDHLQDQRACRLSTGPRLIDTMPRDGWSPSCGACVRRAPQRPRHYRLASPHDGGLGDVGTRLCPGHECTGEVGALELARRLHLEPRYQDSSHHACRFAPMSWQRWALSHNQACESARRANGGRCREGNLRASDITAEADRDERSAWLENGYGDHFLQDSFAAGHLVNKTLVMQWFAEYLADLPYLHWSRLLNLGTLRPPSLERPDWGVPDRASLRGMREDVLNRASPGDTCTPSRCCRRAPPRRIGRAAVSVLDPQTAQERDTYQGRIAGSGVGATTVRTRDEAYRLYLADVELLLPPVGRRGGARPGSTSVASRSAMSAATACTWEATTRS